MIRPAGLALALFALPFASLAADANGNGATRPSLDPSKGWYFSGKGGPSFSQISGIKSQSGAQVTDDAAANVVGAFGMAGGYEWTYRYKLPLRTEIEFMNRTEVTYDVSPLLQGTASGALASTVQNITTMGKAYWHFPVDSKDWWPFVSGGLGWSRNTVKSQYTPSSGSATKSSNTTDDLAWSVGAGATFKLGPVVMNDIEFRYVDLGKVDWGLPAGQNITASGPGAFGATEISFALRAMF